MARNPHFKTSFDSTEIERLQKRAEQSGMKRPQDYIRYLVKHDDENMGVHVAFEERDDWAAKANEAAAEAVRIAESIRENEKLADTWERRCR